MSNDDGGAAPRMMSCDTGVGGDHRAHGFRSTASILLNEEGAFDGDAVEAHLPTTRSKRLFDAAGNSCAP
jgi:hypothetical protein